MSGSFHFSTKKRKTRNGIVFLNFVLFLLFLGPPSLPAQSSFGPTPSIFGPTPSSLGPSPSSLGPPPSSLGPSPKSLGPGPSSLGLTPSSLGPAQSSLGPPSSSLDPSPSSLGPEPSVFKTAEFFSTLTDQGSVFKTTFDDVTTDTFTKSPIHQNIPPIPEYSTSISSKTLPILKGNDRNLKPQKILPVFQGFESNTEEFGGFESADVMPKVCYFVTKIVLTYGEKRIVLVIEKNF